MRIELSARDWLWNAGVAGLYGILENAGDKVEAGDMCIAFDSEALDGLEIKFFDFLNTSLTKNTEISCLFRRC